jgi:hypothetical protein
MSIEGLILSLTVAAIAVLWSAAPLLTGGRSTATSEERDNLVARYQRVLHSIRDLEEDNSLNKLSPEQYAAEREERVQEGIQVLMALDAQGFQTDAKPATKSTNPPVVRKVAGKHA